MMSETDRWLVEKLMAAAEHERSCELPGYHITAEGIKAVFVDRYYWDVLCEYMNARYPAAPSEQEMFETPHVHGYPIVCSQRPTFVGWAFARVAVRTPKEQ